MHQGVEALNKGSFIIEFLRLTYLNGKTLDLIPFTAQFNIFESIYEPAISATAVLDDSAGIIDNDPIIGSTISIKYKSNIELQFVNISFVVESIESIMPNPDGRGQSYILNMFSEESKRALALRVNEIYNKTEPEKMINDILVNKIKTKKKFYFSKTGTIDSINCSSLYPFQAIDAIKKRSVSRKYESSSYVFFENQYGYVFKTLEEILEEAKKDENIISGDMNFFYDISEPQFVKNSAWRKIENLQKIRQGSLNTNIYNGALRSKIFAYDVNTGQHYRFDYDDTINEKSGNFVKVTSRNVYSQGDESGNLVIAPILSENDLPRIKKEILVKAYTSKLTSNILRMEINGDSTLTVGRAAQLNIPKLMSSTNTETNEISSGIYIFCKIRHTFIPAAAAQIGSYRQYCEMMNTGVS